MEIYKTFPFEFNGNKYETRIYHEDRLINVLTFKDNHPVSGIRHQIQVSKNRNIQDILQIEKLNYFIELVKQEILDNLWEKLIN